MTKEKIVKAIFGAVDEANKLSPKERQLEKSLKTVLFGGDGSLDSLGLVSLVVAVEQRIEDEFGITITLANERAMSQKASPFKTLGKLADYVLLLLEERQMQPEGNK